MCMMCSINRPQDPLAGFDRHDGSTGLGSVLDLGLAAGAPVSDGPAGLDFGLVSDSLLAGGGSGEGGGGAPAAPYTWDQIALQLTNGYWEWSEYGGTGPRSFDVSTDRILTYDISGLGATERTIALAAMEIMGEAAGLTFQQVASGPAPTQYTETTDTGGTAATARAIVTNAAVNGAVGSAGDSDWYRVTLVAGQTYTFEMSAAGGSALDSYLELRNSGGAIIAENDDSSGLNSAISFTAATSGTYYISGRGFENPAQGIFSTGNYVLTVTPGAGADITFDNNDGSGAYAGMETTLTRIDRSNINIPSDWAEQDLNGYMLQTYIHELGHALGLGHAGDYNGNALWGRDNLYDNDSWSATIMSYFDMTQNTFDPATQQYLSTMMPADVIALRNLYGQVVNTANTGDTQWGVGANMGGYLQTQILNWISNTVDGFYYNGSDFAFTIVDSTGNDTLDYSNFAMAQELLLTELGYSDIGGQIDNIAIARGTVIENGTTGAGNDTLTGNAVANTLRGNAGNDTLNGDAGNDTLIGGAGRDSLVGGAGTADRASYLDATAGVTASLGFPSTNTGFALGDSYSGIEVLQGSNFGDSLSGDTLGNLLLGESGNDQLDGISGTDTLDGGAGNDTLYGGAGADRLIGGADIDWAAYNESSVGLTVDMQTVANNTGNALGDTYSGVENLWGSQFNDILRGDGLGNQVRGLNGNDTINGNNGNDTLDGGAGNDLMFGGAGGDSFIGGSGNDTVSYLDSSVGVTVDLQAASLNLGGHAVGDSYSGIENVTGTNAEDLLRGDALGNVLIGGGRNDVLQSRSGNDTMYGDGGNDTLSGGDGADFLYGGLGMDVLIGSTGADTFVLNTTIGSSNVETISDFVVADDTIQLENAIFTALGAGPALGAAAFFIGAAATTAAQRIIYDNTNGRLFYDADGAGGAGQIYIARVGVGQLMTSADFVII